MTTDTFAHDPAPNIETTLPGLTLATIEQGTSDGDTIEMTTTCGRTFKLWHSQDCCESVRIDAVRGKLAHLIGTPLTEVKETVESGTDGPYEESWTKTTYRLATAKGAVTIYWLGSSNGYYSESVSFTETTPNAAV